MSSGRLQEVKNNGKSLNVSGRDLGFCEQANNNGDAGIYVNTAPASTRVHILLKKHVEFISLVSFPFPFFLGFPRESVREMDQVVRRG